MAGNNRAKRGVCVFFLVGMAVYCLFLILDSEPEKFFDAEIRRSGPIQDIAEGHRYIYEMPAVNPIGLLFLAHGCNCRAEFFWDPSAACPKCIGLPHDRIYPSKAVSLGYAVIAISSSSRCWNLDTDAQAVVSILKNFRKNHTFATHVPTFAIGASSGGYFVSKLAASGFFKFSAIVNMIAEGVYREDMQLAKDHPRTLFVHMPRDERRARGVSRSMDILRGRGVEVSEIQCLPVKVNPRYFSERILGLASKTSRSIVDAFKEDGILDKGGFPRRDGRSMEWKSSLQKRNLLLPDFIDATLMTKYIQEELNVAYAFHELTGLPSNKVFQWLEKGYDSED